MRNLFKIIGVTSVLALGAAVPALAQEVNIYTTREPGLIQPILDAFTAETGIAVNTVFLESGLIERVQAEGESSPADLLMAVDFGALIDLVNAGVTQPVDSDVLEAAIPETLRDADGNWFALSGRARVVYAGASCASARASTPTIPLSLPPTWPSMARKKPRPGSKASRPTRPALPLVATVTAPATLPPACATSPWPIPTIMA